MFRKNNGLKLKLQTNWKHLQNPFVNHVAWYNNLKKKYNYLYAVNFKTVIANKFIMSWHLQQSDFHSLWLYCMSLTWRILQITLITRQNNLSLAIHFKPVLLYTMYMFLMLHSTFEEKYPLYIIHVLQIFQFFLIINKIL